MFEHLHIYDRRERALVGLADALLAPVFAPARLWRRGTGALPVPLPRRILLLRLERIGDLLMTRHAIAAVRRRAPDATIHLVVGSWNEAIAGLLPEVDRVETLDAPWLVRDVNVEAGRHRRLELVRRALGWRRERYDLAINFEGDIRSNLLLALSGARRRVGFGMAGGGSALTDVVAFDPTIHTAANARRLVERALGEAMGFDSQAATLHLPEAARARAAELVRGEVLVGIHASGGRAIKQWDVERFAETAARLADATGATIVLTGSGADRPVVDRLRAAVPPNVRTIDLAGQMDLVTLAAVLERLDLLIIADTGPMHLAGAVGTPVVAIFGPSDPRRYAPLGPRVAVVRVDLACSPCNRIRRPPARCGGHLPDCLAGVSVDAVCAAALDLLQRPGLKPGRTRSSRLS